MTRYRFSPYTYGCVLCGNLARLEVGALQRLLRDNPGEDPVHLAARNACCMSCVIYAGEVVPGEHVDRTVGAVPS